MMEQLFKADLHVHSTFSDGTSSPEEIICQAVQHNLQGLSITDHDTTKAHSDALYTLAKQKGIELISGVEFSCTYKGQVLHILGYAFALQHPAIHRLTQQHHHRRTWRNESILKKLCAHSMPLSLCDFVKEENINTFSFGTIGRPHIALAMIKKGYVASFAEAFQKYLGDHKLCYVESHGISVEKTIATIQQAGGKAILAHPSIYPSHLIRDIMALPLDGLEGYYSRLFAHQERPWIERAKKKGWLITGGSDFHGTIKPDIALGCSWVGIETFRYLKEIFMSHENRASNHTVF